MDLGIQTKIADLGRLHEIASTFVRYGFGDIVNSMGLGDALKQAGKILKWDRAEELTNLQRPERVRRVLEILGPTFVKLGQILATRVDLFPPSWIAELEKLQTHAPPVDFKELRAQLEEDLGAPPEEIFSKVETEPLGSASMAQVHRATLKDGSEVVLKIRRPGIRSTIESDMRLLTHLATLAEAKVPALRIHRPAKIVQQFVKSMRNELDFAAEGRNAEQIAANFADDEHIAIPKIYWEWTGERLNVQERFDGIPGVDVQAIDKAGMDRKRIAHTGANAVLKMIMIDGVFHADPHPGNFFILPGERIGFVDFGMIGRLSDMRRQQLMRFLYALVQKDSESLATVLLDWSDKQGEEPGELLVELDEFLGKYHGVAMGQMNLAVMLNDLLSLVRENNLTMPPDLAMLIKVFVSLEGAFRQLDPEFDMMTAIRPTLSKAVFEQFSPMALAKRGQKTLLEYVEFLSDLPKEIRRLMQSAQGGKLQVQVDMHHLDDFSRRVTRFSNRIAVATITAALIIGTSLVMSLAEGPVIYGVNIFQGFGIGATVGGIWVLYSIWRDKT